MDRLRLLKSKIEGSHNQLQQLTFNPTSLSQLKNVIASHIPVRLSEQEKARLAQLVSDMLEGRVKRIVYCCVLACPFFAGAQTTETDRARNNVLFLVFVAQDKQFFSLATPHEKGLADVSNQVFISQKQRRCLIIPLHRGVCMLVKSGISV